MAQPGIDRKDVKVIAEVEEWSFRPSEAEPLVGNTQKAMARLGCTVQTGVAETARKMPKADHHALN